VILKILLRSKIHIGIPLPRNIYDVNGQLLLAQKKIIHTELQLSKLLKHGAYIDESILEDGAENTLFAQSLQRTAPIGLLQMWEHIPDVLQTLFTSPQRKYDFAAQVKKFADYLVTLHDMHANFSIYRIVRQENYLASRYGYTHAVHTAVLCILLSRHFEWPVERMMSLVKAALTMNMTIIKLQGKMAGQEGPVERRQRTEIFNHPEKTVALLQVLGVTDANWLAAVGQHHENTGGTGYPTGCVEVCDIANVLRVADVFTAKISPRNFRAALSAQEGILRIFRDDGGGAMSMAVIKTLGIYPPGEFVQMASGELGVVVERTANARAPIVASITDTTGRPVPRLLRRDTQQAEFAITGTVSDKSMLQRLLPERLYGFSIVNPLDLPPLEFLVG
jgi:HD-GYP domain-containing protein (c-di-GMP phosphodiesterase class II)